MPAAPGVARLAERGAGRGLDPGRGLDLGGASVARGAGARRRRGRAARFALVLAGDVVRGEEAGAGIYLLALERLGARRRHARVEDSRNGLEAAAGGRPAVRGHSDGYTEDEDFARRRSS